MKRRPWEIDGDNEWLRYWRLAESHRATLTDLILGAAKPGDSVCVWGAGSCHDLDLKRLMQAGVWLTLVDLRDQNVRWGIEFQLGEEAPAGVQVLAPLDLSGVPRDAMPPLASLAGIVAKHRIEGLGRFDVVVSAGMLSQIVLDVVDAAGEAGKPSTADAILPAKQRATADPTLLAALIAVRRRHLGLMLDHLKPGGAGLLIVDWINSSDAPGIATAEDLQAAVEAAASASDRSHVLAPANLNHDLMLHPPLARRAAEVQISSYWLWQMTERAYACFALRFAGKGA